MTTTFKIKRLSLNTLEGQVEYAFDSPLTVLVGPVGVGKSTLFDLIKYCLGGNAQLAEIAVQSVLDVELDVEAGDEKYRIRRSLDSEKRLLARVEDLVSRDRLADHFVDPAKEPSLSSLLMRALGMSPDMRAAARTKTTARPGGRITFNDIFAYMYVQQGDINQAIASSDESYREPKRKAVFELLFGLTDPSILDMRSVLGEKNGELAQAKRDYATVLDFLRDSETQGREAAEAALAAARNAEHYAVRELGTLRDAVDPVVDRETQTLRDLLGEAERNLAEARQLTTANAQSQVDLINERRRARREIDRLGRLRDAGQRLADFEFVSCPRCMQSLSNRVVAEGCCRLCAQLDPVDDGHFPSASLDTYEERQLEDQLSEIDEQIADSAVLQVRLEEAVGHRERLVEDLSKKIEARTRDRISPQLQAFNDAANSLGEARSAQATMEAVLRQWDRADDVGRSAREIAGEVEALRARLDGAEAQLASRKEEILSELSDEFTATVATIGIPGVTSASISMQNYLPILNGASYVKLSPAGGGIRTATQVAYWITLVTVALRRRDTAYPAFLLIDSPRLSLNDNPKLEAPLYRRLVTQVDADGDRLQMIVGDNEIPDGYRGTYEQMDFSYDDPTVYTIAHPGPDAVGAGAAR
ncbi:hypothetical protein GCM10009836_43640 [Pseudonocardia ailaonensis]|uniref:Nuclease SbcCD subunit C n=1 Tax=Pseudonocardia ailaonensis TaxID=367279 RepID=A0ABN2NAN7_9PSEU